MGESVIERERILTDAARRYLRGEISYEELTRIRRSRAPAPPPPPSSTREEET